MKAVTKNAQIKLLVSFSLSPSPPQTTIFKSEEMGRTMFFFDACIFPFRRSVLGEPNQPKNQVSALNPAKSSSRPVVGKKTQFPVVPGSTIFPGRSVLNRLTKRAKL
jgi:hypothetical protein